MFKTQISVVNEEILRQAGELIRSGELVAFPTETVYGLGADGLNPQAVAKIYEAKGRPSDNPLILHVASMDQARALVADLPPMALSLAESFWPGPLTMVLPKSEKVPQIVTGGLDTVAIRLPQHPVAIALIQAACRPLAAPSANLSGRPSPTQAQHVFEDLCGRIPLILDGGETGIGLESTVIDLTTPIPTLLRPGGVSWEALQALLGEVAVDPQIQGEVSRPRSPGMKYTHYAPQGEMVVVLGEERVRRKRIRELALAHLQAGERVGILSLGEAYQLPHVVEVQLGEEPSQVAQRLYGALREMDHTNCQFILAEGLPQEGLGRAVMNRLIKAAGHRVWRIEEEEK